MQQWYTNKDSTQNYNGMTGLELGDGKIHFTISYIEHITFMWNLILS